MDGFEIEVQGAGGDIGSALAVPSNVRTVGKVKDGDVRVFIRQDVYRALERYALADVSRERGTILLGSYGEADGGIHVVISAYVEAKYADSAVATLTFTHDTWAYVHSQREQRFPDKKIVGWQHTHPDFGVFLSTYDMFIHENFFDLPFQVAYVIDPIRRKRGFFQWKDGEVRELDGFYVYDREGRTINLDLKKQKKPRQTGTPPRRKR